MFGACITIQLLDLKLEGSCALAMGILPGRSQPLDENGFSTRRTGWSWHNERAFRNPSCACYSKYALMTYCETMRCVLKKEPLSEMQ